VNLRRLVPLSFALLLGGCATVATNYAAIDSCLAAGRAWNYRLDRCETADPGPVHRILVDKSDHIMSAFRDGKVVREFRVALGSGGLGPKQKQGDGRVPEGTYRITAHNPDSAFHLSLRIGYPTSEQIAAAAKRGENPGGDIMIHGLPNERGWIGAKHASVDWTDGCIAVTNPEMEWLFKAVADGTPIEIRA